MQTVVITGANRGIGLALTRSFVDAGDHVIAACRHPAMAAELQALQKTGNVEIVALDVTSADSVAALANSVGNRTIDVLINNAGIMGGDQQDSHDMDYAEWLHTFDVNTLAPFRVTMALLPALKRSKRARVITVSSQMGAFGLPMGYGRYAYRSSKAAVSKVMQVLAEELKADGIVVCPVHPGWVQTDMGGPQAQITPAQSAGGLHRLISDLTLEKSGRFWTWEGREHVW
ncbi:MAG TPA: SDR family oxidoreductase [Candidatus Acidoferrum sp.]|nr:SDR family oxidoreductase [Candidatus Acidoferrum sp.]